MNIIYDYRYNIGDILKVQTTNQHWLVEDVFLSIGGGKYKIMCLETSITYQWDAKSIDSDEQLLKVA